MLQQGTKPFSSDPHEQNATVMKGKRSANVSIRTIDYLICELKNGRYQLHLDDIRLPTAYDCFEDEEDRNHSESDRNEQPPEPQQEHRHILQNLDYMYCNEWDRARDYSSRRDEGKNGNRRDHRDRRRYRDNRNYWQEEFCKKRQNTGGSTWQKVRRTIKPKTWRGTHVWEPARALAPTQAPECSDNPGADLLALSSSEIRTIAFSDPVRLQTLLRDVIRNHRCLRPNKFQLAIPNNTSISLKDIKPSTLEPDERRTATITACKTRANKCSTNQLFPRIHTECFLDDTLRNTQQCTSRAHLHSFAVPRKTGTSSRVHIYRGGPKQPGTRATITAFPQTCGTHHTRHINSMILGRV